MKRRLRLPAITKLQTSLDGGFLLLTSIDQIHVPSLRIDFLLLQRFLYLRELKHNHLIMDISIRVILSHNVHSLFLSIFRDQESWTFRKKPEKAELESTWRDLEQTWKSPRPIA